MFRRFLPSTLSFAFVLCVAGPAVAQMTEMTADEMVSNALRAGPPSVTGNATIKDWEGNVLREGSNGWTCLPAIPDTPGDDPMCLDDQWTGWVEAWMNQTEPTTSRLAIGYMLQGGSPGSNTDPFAEGPTPDNEWMEEDVPHVMIIAPDASWFDGLPTSPEAGGPWVMWRDTPYAHLMVPTNRNPD